MHTLALICVVDSSDLNRMCEARDFLRKTVLDDSFPSPILLLLANKQDSPNAFSPARVEKEVLDSSYVRKLLIFKTFGTVAEKDKGLAEAFAWLHNTIREHVCEEY